MKFLRRISSGSRPSCSAAMLIIRSMTSGGLGLTEATVSAKGGLVGHHAEKMALVVLNLVGAGHVHGGADDRGKAASNMLAEVGVDRSRRPRIVPSFWSASSAKWVCSRA